MHARKIARAKRTHCQFERLPRDLQHQAGLGRERAVVNHCFETGIQLILFL